MVSQSKLVILRSLSTFLQICLSNDTGLLTSALPTTSNRLNTWFLLPSFTRSEDYYSFEKILQSSQSSAHNHFLWQENVDPEDNEDDFPGAFTVAETPIASDSFTLQQLGDISNIFGSSELDAVNDRKAELVAVRVSHHSSIIPDSN